MPSSLHFGHLHFPLFGLCAALGLMAALLLCRMTARLARLDASAAADAMLVAVLSAFFISRALLVAGSWRSFLAAPLLVLALPTLNDTGLLLTAVVTTVYLRRRRLPILGFLDAMAPCAALVWAFLSLGRVLEGTRDGMPTRFFLAVGTGASVTGGVQPVEFYTMVVAIFLCGLLLRALTHRHQPGLIRARGLIFARGLVLAGVALFLLDFLRLPSELFVPAMLDPVQWLALAMVTVGSALFLATPASRPPGTSDAV